MKSTLSSDLIHFPIGSLQGSGAFEALLFWAPHIFIVFIYWRLRMGPQQDGTESSGEPCVGIPTSL